MLRPNDIEDFAEKRLIELEKQLGTPLPLPIPLYLLAEKVLGLDFLWDKIEEAPGEQVLGCLDADRRLIILNEEHRGLFEGKPGLERSTIGHEMGHWDLFIEPRINDSPRLIKDIVGEKVAYRADSESLAHLTKLVRGSKSGWELIGYIQSKADDPFEKSAVNRYAAALSMPREIIKNELAQIDKNQWPALYDLAKRFGVTISALVVRLEQLNLLAVGSDKRIYDSKEEAAGQLKLI